MSEQDNLRISHEVLLKRARDEQHAALINQNGALVAELDIAFQRGDIATKRYVELSMQLIDQRARLIGAQR